MWRERSYGTRSIETQSGRHVAFATVEIEAPPAGRRRAVWYVYLVDTVPVANDYWGKALQAWTRIVSPGRALWSLAFSAESVDPSVDPSAVLAAFTREYFESFTKHSAASGASL